MFPKKYSASSAYEENQTENNKKFFHKISLHFLEMLIQHFRTTPMAKDDRHK
jgi:hypothetical protein